MIEQALYGSRDARGYRFLARSPGFRDEWLQEAERLCIGFGERPAGVHCPRCAFAQPFGSRHVAIVEVTDRGEDDAGRPGTLLFRILIIPRVLYGELGNDPFWLLERIEPLDATPSDLPSLTWAHGPPPPRTVAGLRKLLDVPNSAVLLGGVQALLDGGRLVFERREPAEALVRALWQLLPTSSRGALWPATFAFGGADRFDVVVVPRAAGPAFARHVDEVQAGDYPEGRFELALQTAVEAGDQEELDALLARRSRPQVLRLALALLAVFTIGPLAVALLVPGPQQAKPLARADVSPLRLPSANECPRLSAVECAAVARQLRILGEQLGVAIDPAPSEAGLVEGLAALDKRLGLPDARRDPGPLRDLGPVQRQVRALLWKQEVAGYDQRSLNTAELLEKLSQALVRPPLPANDKP